METEAEAIRKIADILKKLEEDMITFSAANGYGGRSYPSDPAQIVASIRDYTNSLNSNIQHIRIELRKLTRDQELLKRIMGN